MQLKWAPKKIYAFEPVKETYDLLVENIRLNKMENRIVPINLALGAKKGKATIYFAMPGDGAATIAFARKNCNARTIKIATIDSFMNGKGRVDFIKMDTEGYEGPILLGAKKTIRSFKPVLSFSAYHNADDKLKLPEIVREIRSDYKCVLHRYSEEDIYCD